MVESYERGTSNVQLMSSVITLSHLRGSTVFRNGTKIFFTSGNYNKTLESIMIQIYCTLNPEFKCLSVMLKKWVNDISHPVQKPKFQLKWTSIIFLLIFYMQQQELLPVLDEKDLIEVRELLMKQDVNFTDEQSKESLLRLQRGPKTDQQCFVNTFHMIKIPIEILRRVKVIRNFKKAKKRSDNSC
jgi:hypothetical protein